MNKKYLLSAVIAFAPAIAGASDGVSALEEGLAAYANGEYEGVKVIENGDALTVKFPQTETIEFKSNDKGALETVNGSIPGYDAVAVKDGEFKGADVYKITTSSADRLRADIYKKFSINGGDVESYNSEMQFVPALRFMKGEKFDAKNIIFSQVDKQTGLKQEVAGVGSVSFQSSFTPADNEILYSMTWNADNIRLAGSFMSFMIPHVENKMNVTFRINEDTDFNKLINGSDFNKMIADVDAFKQSDSLFVINNMSVDSMGTKVSGNVIAGGKGVVDEATQNLRVAGKSEISDIKLENMDDFPLQNVKIKYLLKNISMKDVARLQKLITEAEKIEEEKNKDPKAPSTSDEEEQLMRDLASVIEDVTKQMEFKFDADLNFVQSDIKILSALKKSGKFLVGNVEVTIYNLDLLVPDFSKQCEEEQKLNPSSYPQSCMKAGFSSSFSEYIDKSKRTTDEQGRTVDKVEIVLTETGIFVNGENVGDPIEFDLNSMIAENMMARDSVQAVETPEDAPKLIKEDID